MDDALVRLLWERAGYQCEYCRMPYRFSTLPFEVDHIVARKHQGKTSSGNLALSCAYDNAFKGSNIAGIDPMTGRLTKLFHPRRHKWDRHFRWNGPILEGRTAIGRATVAVLVMNHPLRVDQRRELIDAGLFHIIAPPPPRR
jgi:hypothetical protein